MKCPKCITEMKYFKDHARKVDGYKCPVCGEKKIIVAHSIDPLISDDEDMFTQYGWSIPGQPRI